LALAKSFSDLLAADQGAFIFDEDAQNLERLFLEKDARAAGACRAAKFGLSPERQVFSAPIRNLFS